MKKYYEKFKNENLYCFEYLKTGVIYPHIAVAEGKAKYFETKKDKSKYLEHNNILLKPIEFLKTENPVNEFNKKFDSTYFIKDFKGVKNIKYITSTFYEKFKEHEKQLLKLIDYRNLVNELQTEDGIFIINHPDGNRKVCVVYSFNKNRFISVSFYKIFLQFYTNYNLQEDLYDWITINSSDYNEIVYPYEERNIVPLTILHLLWFIKYCKTEIKILPTNKTQKIFNCKYSNDTNHDIQIIDSTWFTTLVKSDSFKVSGHFRMQPYGKNWSEKKLIWISDFEKKGYLRTYKRPLNEQDNNYSNN